MFGPSIQFRHWSKRKQYRPFSKSLFKPESSQDWMRETYSDGEATDLTLWTRCLANWSNTWSTSSCECPVLRQRRLTLETTPFDVNQAMYLNIILFLNSRGVLSVCKIMDVLRKSTLWLSCSRVRQCENNSTIVDESFGISGVLTENAMKYPWQSAQVMWSRGLCNELNSLDR